MSVRITDMFPFTHPKGIGGVTIECDTIYTEHDIKKALKEVYPRAEVHTLGNKRFDVVVTGDGIGSLPAIIARIGQADDECRRKDEEAIHKVEEYNERLEATVNQIVKGAARHE